MLCDGRGWWGWHGCAGFKAGAPHGGNSWPHDPGPFITTLYAPAGAAGRGRTAGWRPSRAGSVCSSRGRSAGAHAWDVGTSIHGLHSLGRPCKHSRPCVPVHTCPFLHSRFPAQLPTLKANTRASSTSVARPGRKDGWVGTSTLYRTWGSGSRHFKGLFAAWLSLPVQVLLLAIYSLASKHRMPASPAKQHIVHHHCAGLTCGTTDRPTRPDTSCHDRQIPSCDGWLLLAGSLPARRARHRTTATPTSTAARAYTGEGMMEARASYRAGSIED